MDKIYQTSIITVQGVPYKYGKNREKSDFKLIDAIKLYLKANLQFSPSRDESHRLV